MYIHISKQMDREAPGGAPPPPDPPAGNFD